MCPTESVRSFDEIIRFLEGRIGLSTTDANREVLRLRLERLTRKHGTTMEELRDRVRLDPDAYAELVDVATTHETRFFREPDTLHYLTGNAIPIRCRNSDTPVRILSAGCATGEEVFSLRICLLNDRPELTANVSIDGVDLSARCIQTARGGTFSKHAMRDVSLDILQTFFTAPSGEHFQLHPDVFQNIGFFVVNLLEDPLPSPGYDMILCRNLLMYLTETGRSRLLRKLYQVLKPGGLLFLGKAESIRTDKSRFLAERAGTVFFYRRV